MLSAVLLVVGCTIGYNLYTNYRTITRQEEQRLMVQAQVIASNMERQLAATSLVMQKLVADLEHIRDQHHQELTNRQLATLVEAMPGVRTLFFTDAAGTVQGSNRPELVGKNFQDRDYFRQPLNQPDPSALYISPPFQSVLNVYLFNLTRMIAGADGRFDGIITASINPDYFATLLQSVIYAPDMLTYHQSWRWSPFYDNAAPGRSGRQEPGCPRFHVYSSYAKRQNRQHHNRHRLRNR